MRANGIQGAKRRGQAVAHDDPGPGGAAAGRSRPARLHRLRPGRALVRRFHLPALLGGRRLLLVRDRRLQPPDRRLAVRRPHAHRPRPRRAPDGARPARARRGRRADPSQRRRVANICRTTTARPSTTTACSRRSASVGDAYDNALAESFVDSFKTELIRDRVWRTRSQLELAIVEYVAWFNNERLHTSLGGVPPAEYEEVRARRRVENLRLIEKRKPTKPVSAEPGRAQTARPAPTARLNPAEHRSTPAS